MTEGFDKYRRRKGYSKESIKVHNSDINRFKSWCIRQDIDHEKISYDQLLQFIGYERQRGIQNQSIVREIGSLRIYYDYLQEERVIKHNIIKRVRIRQTAGKIILQALSPKELDKIYYDFVNLPEWEHDSKRTKHLHRRDSVILGLLVYQGLRSGEIAKLEKIHVNLTEGKIYIPSTRKSNARTLKLKANQVLAIKAYMEQIRDNQSGYLFTTSKHSDMVCRIIDKIRKSHPELTGSRQIRASVIMNWLKTNNIRQVQYMAGHKSIRSTERYRSQDLSGLTKQLELFHPLG